MTAVNDVTASAHALGASRTFWELIERRAARTPTARSCSRRTGA